MDAAGTETNLLFGLMALQRGSIDAEAFLAALKAWEVNKQKPLEDILAEQRMLSREEVTKVKQSVQAHLQAHQNDPGKSLAAVDLQEAITKLRPSLQERDLLRAVGLPNLGREVSIPLEATHGPATGAGTLAASQAQQATLEATQAVSVGPPSALGTGTGAGNPYATQDGGQGPPTIPAMPPLEVTADLTGGSAPGQQLQTVSFVEDVGATQDQTALGPAAGAQPGAPRAPEPGSGTSGFSRYRVIRRHARGGLGEVFVAFDEELRREVALKEIQGRHADRMESRLRFLLEAEVTGGLEHPGIVPVYGLGRYPDGRPYYAMRFIRGECFKDAVDRYHEANKTRRNPAEAEVQFRVLLNRFIDVCHAIGYAHSRGVLHRDIKPANVMLGDYGETLVVDWGLAKLVNQKDAESITGIGPLRPLSAGEKSETLYGSALGTPQYMSPEQAAGKLETLGPSSDVYSLGATLYYVLTGDSAFRDLSLAVVLDKVQRGDFPRPREVNHAVPPALEAICLKAMATKPEDRYQTATEMVTDLEQWLADEPVSVYREPFLARAGRWAKRHKRAVTALAVFLITAVTGLSVFSILIKREQARTQANFVLARAAVDQMLTELGEVELAEVPQMEQVRKKMLGKALDFYQKFLKEHGNDNSIREETGRANIRLGDILEMLGDYEGAEKAYDRAIALLEPMVARWPAMADYRRDLARAHHELGVLQKKAFRFEEGEANLTEAKKMRQELVAQNPKDDHDLHDAKDSVYQLGTLLAKLAGRQGDAEKAYKEAVSAETTLSEQHPDDLEFQRKLARYKNNRGILIMGSDVRGAEDEFQGAFDIQDKLAQKAPTVAGLQWERARSLSNLGSVLDREKKFDAAEKVYRKAADALKLLSDQFPSIPDYENELASVYTNLGLSLDRLGKPDQAAAQLTEAVGVLDRLARRFPHRPDYARRMANAQLFLAKARGGLSQMPEAQKWAALAGETLTNLVASFPMVPEYQSELAYVLDFRARLLFKDRKYEQARDSLQAAITHLRLAMEDSRHNRLYREKVLQEYDVLTNVLKEIGDYAGAAKAAGEVVRNVPNDAIAHERAARLMAVAVEIVMTNTEIPAREKTTLSQSLGDQAIVYLREALRFGLRNAKELDRPIYKTIRDRNDFKALQKELEARAKPAVV